MRVAVVGAGAIGSFIGVRLAAAEHDVTLVGRAQQVEVVERQGLTVRDPQGIAKIYRPTMATRITSRPEVVLLAVKTQDVSEACAQVKADLGDDLAGVTLVTLQNSVRADELAAEVVGEENVAGAVVMIAATHLQTGEISVQFPGWMVAGEPFGAVRARTRAVVQLLNSAVPTFLTHHLPRARWTKLIFNLTNGLSAATGLSVPELGAQPLGRELVVQVMREGVRVARAAGYPPEFAVYGVRPDIMRHDRRVPLLSLLLSLNNTALTRLPIGVSRALLSLGARSSLSGIAVKGSTWQSIERGRPSEVDYLNGEIVTRGKQLGILTPYNARVADAVHDVERQHAFKSLRELVPDSAARPVGGRGRA